MKIDKARMKNILTYSTIYFLCAITIIPIILILLFITFKGIVRIDWNFLTSISTSLESGGILAPILGTIYLTVLTMVFAVPTGVFSAIYMAEYAKRGSLFKIIEVTIVNLAGVPSIVYGLFGLGIFVYMMGFGISVLAGALTLACLVLPLIITVSYQALRGVPNTYREASYGLGASKLQTVFRIVLPQAIPNILTGIILATARVAGETAPVLFTAAAYFLPDLPQSVFDQTMLLSYHLFAISTQVANVPEAQKYGVTLVLIALVILLNGTAIYIRGKLNKKLNVSKRY